MINTVNLRETVRYDQDGRETTHCTGWDGRPPVHHGGAAARRGGLMLSTVIAVVGTLLAAAVSGHRRTMAVREGLRLDGAATEAFAKPGRPRIAPVRHRGAQGAGLDPRSSRPSARSFLHSVACSGT